MERFDLAHVDPSEGGFDALGKGEQEGRAEPNTRYVSKGLTRSRTDKLSVVSAGSQAAAKPRAASRYRPTSRRCTQPARPRSRPSPRRKLSPAQALESLAWLSRSATPRRKPPNAGPRRRPRATKARCAASAGISLWSGTDLHEVRHLRQHDGVFVR